MGNKMRLLIISLVALLLQGCAAMYSMSPPVDKEPFQAKGKSVAVQYEIGDASTLHSCASNIVFVFNPCRGGSAGQRAGEFIDLLGGYGFNAYQAGSKQGAKPDYTIVVKEVSTADPDDTKDLGFMMLSSFTIGVFPVISDARPAGLSYTLYKGNASAQTKLHGQEASTHVKTLGGIYFLVMGPANYSANQSSLLTEHDRAVQNWIQGGLFE